MLKDKENLLLTKEECELLTRIATDSQTGNHLLHPRSEAFWKMGREYAEADDAVKAGKATERQEQMVEYVRQCQDYFYWRTLPEDKKLFVETKKI